MPLQPPGQSETHSSQYDTFPEHWDVEHTEFIIQLWDTKSKDMAGSAVVLLREMLSEFSLHVIIWNNESNAVHAARWRVLSFPLSASRFARSKSTTREKAGYRREVDELDPETVCRKTASESTKELGEPRFLSMKGWRERHQGVCLVTRYTARFSVGKCPVWYRGKADDFSLHSDDVGHAISDSPIKGSLNSGTRRTPDV